MSPRHVDLSFAQNEEKKHSQMNFLKKELAETRCMMEAKPVVSHLVIMSILFEH